MRRVAAYILCGLVVSCTEYDLGEQDGINEAGTDAQGEVSPESVVGAICGGEAETTLTLSSVGTAPLVLEDVQVTAGDWTVDRVVLPATVAPDTSLTLVLRGTGDGELVLTTNDLDEPSFRDTGGRRGADPICELVNPHRSPHVGPFHVTCTTSSPEVRPIPLGLSSRTLS